MFGSILGAFGAIPGLIAGLGRAVVGGLIYLAGRREQAAADKIRELDLRAEGQRRAQKVQEDLRRLAPDARRDRLRRWERKPKP